MLLSVLSRLKGAVSEPRELAGRQRRHSMLHQAGDDSHMCWSGCAGPGDYACQTSKSLAPTVTGNSTHWAAGLVFWTGKKLTKLQQEDLLWKGRWQEYVWTLYCFAGQDMPWSSLLQAFPPPDSSVASLSLSLLPPTNLWSYARPPQVSLLLSLGLDSYMSPHLWSL